MKLRGRSIWMNQRHLKQKGFQKRVMLPLPSDVEGLNVASACLENEWDNV